MKRRGFTLIEGVTAVIVLSLALPITVTMLSDATTARVASVQRERVTLLVDLLRGSVVADGAAISDGYGLSGIQQPSYETDLRARLAPLTQPYEDAGLAWSLSTAALVGPRSVVEADADLNAYLPVTITVSWPDPREGTRTFSVTLYIAEVGV